MAELHPLRSLVTSVPGQMTQLTNNRSALTT